MKTDKYTIIKAMLSQEDTFTYQQLAGLLNLSSRTIRNQIVDIEEVLSHYNITCFRHPGVGIQIQGSREDILNCYQFCTNQIKNSSALPSAIRKNIILFTLLTQSKKLSMRYFEDLLYITRPSIYNDLKEIEQGLSNYDIHISKSRKDGLFLVTGEKRRRNCLLDWALSMKDKELDNYYAYPKLLLFLEYLFDDDKNKNRTFLKSFIKKLDEYAHLNIVPDELERITTLFLISFTFVQKESYVNINKNLVKKIRNTKIIDYLKKHVADLNLYFNMQMNDGELLYMASLLSSTMTSSFEVAYEESVNPPLLFEVIDLYYKELLHHLQPFDVEYFKIKLFPFLEKVMQKSNFVNDLYTPLHDEIKTLYPRLYECASAINPIMLEKLYEQLNDSGIATLTLLLASIKEKQTLQLTCHYIPTNLLFDDDLKINIIKRNIPNLTIITDETISTTEKENIDFIITHQPLPSSTIPVFVAPHLFTDEFIALLKRTVSDILAKKEKDFYR